MEPSSASGMALKVTPSHWLMQLQKVSSDINANMHGMPFNKFPGILSPLRRYWENSTMPLVGTRDAFSRNQSIPKIKLVESTLYQFLAYDCDKFSRNTASQLSSSYLHNCPLKAHSSYITTLNETGVMVLPNTQEFQGCKMNQ